MKEDIIKLSERLDAV